MSDYAQSGRNYVKGSPLPPPIIVQLDNTYHWIHHNNNNNQITKTSLVGRNICKKNIQWVILRIYAYQITILMKFKKIQPLLDALLRRLHLLRQ